MATRVVRQIKKRITAEARKQKRGEALLSASTRKARRRGELAAEIAAETEPAARMRRSIADNPSRSRMK